jgi:hypothetical protein
MAGLDPAIHALLSETMNAMNQNAGPKAPRTPKTKKFFSGNGYTKADWNAVTSPR